MKKYFVKLLLEKAIAKEGLGYVGKPASFYNDLLASGVNKVDLLSSDYINFDEAELNVDLIYGMTFKNATETWIEEYPYKMNFSLNKENKLQEFYEKQGS